MKKAHKIQAGYFLIEMLAAIGVIILLFGSVAAAAMGLQRILASRIKREEQSERVQKVIRDLRDDLRAARQVDWTRTNSTGDRLSVQRGDGKSVVYTLTPSFTRTEETAAQAGRQERIEIALSIKDVQIAADDAAGLESLWNLKSQPPPAHIQAPRFVLLKLELKQPGFAPRTILAGASPRSEEKR